MHKVLGNFAQNSPSTWAGLCTCNKDWAGVTEEEAGFPKHLGWSVCVQQQGKERGFRQHPVRYRGILMGAAKYWAHASVSVTNNSSSPVASSEAALVQRLHSMHSEFRPHDRRHISRLTWLMGCTIQLDSVRTWV